MLRASRLHKCARQPPTANSLRLRITTRCSVPWQSRRLCGDACLPKQSRLRSVPSHVACDEAPADAQTTRTKRRLIMWRESKGSRFCLFTTIETMWHESCNVTVVVKQMLSVYIPLCSSARWTATTQLSGYLQYRHVFTFLTVTQPFDPKLWLDGLYHRNEDKCNAATYSETLQMVPSWHTYVQLQSHRL